ncbi:MAG: hypothetical protein KF870_17180 [Leadbetterella sp.]|nr:hypothetical protein [Leadbetterella sp.]
MRIKFLIFFLLSGYFVTGQTVYEPTYRSVYQYLSRLAQRGVIDVHDVIQPISRKNIAIYLHELEKNPEALTGLEKKELEYYAKEYSYETLLLYSDSLLKQEAGLTLFKIPKGDRPRFVATQSRKFTANAQPIFGYDYFGNSEGQSYGVMRAGFWASGYIGKQVGFSLDYRSNIAKGDGIDFDRSFTPEPGVIGERKKNGDFVYTDVKASVSYDWDWGTLTLAKDKMPVGYGYSGKIILSDKAPTFPLIRLDVQPLRWLAFNYAHLWLNSDVVDSTRIRYSGYGNRYQVNHVPKKMAIHSFILTPFKGLNVLIGESIIYNDELKLSYLIPVNFFRSAALFEGEASRGTTFSNTQVFFQISSRNHIPKTHLFTSWYIDDVYHKKGVKRRQYAFNTGISVTDVLLPNLTLSADYAKIYPYAYMHHMNTLTYQHAGYTLGHWLGTNADIVNVDLRYRVLRGLELMAGFQKIRKGSEGKQGEQLSAVNIPFLWGDLRKISQTSFAARYEFTADLFLRVAYQADQENKRYSMGLTYGF